MTDANLEGSFDSDQAKALRRAMESVHADGILLNPTEVNDVVQVRTVEDLPNPSGGVRTLDSTKTYYFTSIVATINTVDPNGAPLLSPHGSVGGLIHTGGGTALETSGSPFFARSMYLHAPGGTLFDLSADDSTEFLFQDSSISDAAALGNLASLGTIDGYRVPSFKDVNFEQFDDGLTFSGTSKKVFFSGCPFRTIDANSVTILSFDASFDSEVVKLGSGCYIKNVQPDTVVASVDPSATISQFFKFYNVDLDATVAKSNVLEGAIGNDSIGTIVRNSVPLSDSHVLGELFIDAAATISGSGAGATEINSTTAGGETFTLSVGQRVSENPEGGNLRYDAQYDSDVQIDARVTVEGANTSYRCAVELNGTEVPGSAAEGSTSGASKPDTVEPGALLEQMTDGDVVDVTLENTDGSTDLTVNVFEMEVTEV
jgi:hypothetical protein